MGATALGDIINPVAISAYFNAFLLDHLVFMDSGAATVDFDSLTGSGGDSITIKRFAEDTTADEVNDGSQGTISGLSSVKDVGVVLHRKRIRGVDDVIKAVLGTGDADAVNREIAVQNTYYWSKRSEGSLVNVLGGLFDDTAGVLRTSHRNKVSANANYAAVIDSIKLLGDNMNDLALMIVHPKVWADLCKETASKANFLPLAGPDGSLARQPFYDGKRVIISQQVPKVTISSTDYYSTFFCRPGSLYFSYQRTMGAYYQLQADYPREIITTTMDFVAHVRGTKWVGSFPAGGPLNSDLATAANWNKANTAQDKEIGVVQLLSEASA